MEIPVWGYGEMELSERLLLALARRPDQKRAGSTVTYTIANCLDFTLRAVPDLIERIRGKRVLEVGCGHGYQSVAMALRGAREVVGCDVVPAMVEHARTLAAKHNAGDRAHFTLDPLPLPGFDVVISISAFEHYSDPEEMVQLMRQSVAPGGEVIIAFAEPWWSPNGSHFSGYTALPGTDVPVPWVNLFFPDRALLRLRERFRPDHPSRLEDISGGLNRMTLRRFERIIHESGMTVESMSLFSTKGLPFVSHVPVLRELLTSSASCILRSR